MKPNLKRAARQISLLMPFAMLLAGCQTIPLTSPQIQIIAGVKAIPCRDLQEIDFASPESPDEEDLNNELDTFETIRQIRSANAAFQAICKGQ